mgnify:CR=1 FL=1
MAVRRLQLLHHNDILLIDRRDDYMVGKIAVFQIQNLLTAYKERFDKDNFIKNLLLDNFYASLSPF